MEHLTQPLIKENEVSTPRTLLTTLEEQSLTGSNERDSSFIEIKHSRRTASLPAITKEDMHDGKRRYVSLSVADPRNSFRSPKNSVVVSGDDRFILEESESASIEGDDGDEQSIGRFINVHVSFKLGAFILFFAHNTTFHTIYDSCCFSISEEIVVVIPPHH